MKINSTQLRLQFPRLAAEPDLAYLDSAATGLAPQTVIDAATAAWSHSYGPIGRSPSSAGARATELFESARARLAAFLGAELAEIVFTKSCTEALNVLAFGLTSSLQAGDEILATEAEHHANLLPWQRAAEISGARLRFIPVSISGELDLSELDSLLNPKTKIVSLALISNVLGARFPVEEIIQKARQVGAKVVLDAAQAAAHEKLNPAELGCDGLAISGHKMYGPPGIGVLWLRPEFAAELPPLLLGGGAVEDAGLVSRRLLAGPEKFEAGTQNLPAAAGLAAAADFIDQLGLEAIREHEFSLARQLAAGLDSIPGLRILGRPELGASLVSFAHESVHAADLAAFIDAERIAVRVGRHCAHPLHARLGLSSTVRASFAAFSSEAEVERLLAAVQKGIRALS